MGFLGGQIIFGEILFGLSRERALKLNTEKKIKNTVFYLSTMDISISLLIY